MVSVLCAPVQRVELNISEVERQTEASSRAVSLLEQHCRDVEAAGVRRSVIRALTLCCARVCVLGSIFLSQASVRCSRVVSGVVTIWRRVLGRLMALGQRKTLEKVEAVCMKILDIDHQFKTDVLHRLELQSEAQTMLSVRCVRARMMSGHPFRDPFVHSTALRWYG